MNNDILIIRKFKKKNVRFGPENNTLFILYDRPGQTMARGLYTACHQYMCGQRAYDDN